MAKNATRVRVREIEVERLILRESDGGRVRAVLETVPEARGHAARIRFVLLAADGTVALSLHVGSDGSPVIELGDCDHGDALRLTRSAVDIWADGNAVVGAWAHAGAGHIEVLDRRGKAKRGVRQRRKPVVRGRRS